MGDDDPIARLRAEMDQTREGTREFAGIVSTFYKQIVDDGVGPAHACAITCSYIAGLLAMPRPKDDA
jgi:hypothetical protein